MMAWLWTHKGGSSFASSQRSLTQQHRAKVLVLPAWAGELPLKSLALPIPRLGSDSIPVCLARFKVVPHDHNKIQHPFKASIHYIDRISADPNATPLETTICRVEQACWHPAQSSQSLDLILALHVGGRLMALQDAQVEPGPANLACGLFPIHAIAAPLARVTLLDAHDGSKWQIDYKVHPFPLRAMEVSGLTQVGD